MCFPLLALLQGEVHFYDQPAVSRSKHSKNYIRRCIRISSAPDWFLLTHVPLLSLHAARKVYWLFKFSILFSLKFSPDSEHPVIFTTAECWGQLYDQQILTHTCWLFPSSCSTLYIYIYSIVWMSNWPQNSEWYIFRNGKRPVEPHA